MLAPSDLRGGMVARVKTSFLATSDKCLELFYKAAGESTDLLVMAVREDRKALVLHKVCIHNNSLAQGVY